MYSEYLELLFFSEVLANYLLFSRALGSLRSQDMLQHSSFLIGLLTPVWLYVLSLN
jgi:hypothetical protein